MRNDGKRLESFFWGGIFYSAHTHTHTTSVESLRSRVRGARREVEGKGSEGGEYGAGTWRRSRIMEVEGRSGSQDGAHTAPWPNGTALCALQCGHSATFAVVTEPKTCPQL